MGRSYGIEVLVAEQKTSRTSGWKQDKSCYNDGGKIE